jgi:hypothetical protein
MGWKLSNYQTIELSNYRTIKLSNYQIIKLSNYQTIKLSNQYIHSYPPYWRLFLHPQHEDASCRGNFLTSYKPVSFSRRTLLHGVSKNAIKWQAGIIIGLYRCSPKQIIVDIKFKLFRRDSLAWKGQGSSC